MQLVKDHDHFHFELASCAECQLLLFKSAAVGELKYQYDPSIGLWLCVENHHYFESLIKQEVTRFSNHQVRI